jgi:hypothetical protein
MTIDFDNFIDYQEAMELFHNLMQRSINNDFFRRKTLRHHCRLARIRFDEEIFRRDLTVPWTVKRRLNQLSKIFDDLTGRSVC